MQIDMEGKTTTQLFEQVINTRKIHELLNCTPNAAQKLRVNHKAGKVSLDKMHEVLKLAGYQIVQPTLWAESPRKVVMDRLIEVMVHVQDSIERSQPK